MPPVTRSIIASPPLLRKNGPPAVCDEQQQVALVLPTGPADSVMDPVWPA